MFLLIAAYVKWAELSPKQLQAHRNTNWYSTFTIVLVVFKKYRECGESKGHFGVFFFSLNFPCELCTRYGTLAPKICLASEISLKYPCFAFKFLGTSCLSTEVQLLSFVCFTGGKGSQPRLWNIQNLGAVPPYHFAGGDDFMPSPCTGIEIGTTRYLRGARDTGLSYNLR